jgi:hypothetical protein
MDYAKQDAAHDAEGTPAEEPSKEELEAQAQQEREDEEVVQRAKACHRLGVDATRSGDRRR